MKVLILGPLPPPYHGQSIALSTLVSSFADQEKIVISTTNFRFKPMNIVYSNLLVLLCFLCCKFDVIYFTSTRNRSGFMTKDFLLLLLGKWSKKRIINHLHGANFKSFYRSCGMLQPLVRYCYEGVHSSIVLMDAMQPEFEDFPAMKVHTVGNCYAKEFESYKGPEIKTGYRVLFLSNLMRSKGILEFLDACLGWFHEASDVSVTIAGVPYNDDYCKRNEISALFWEKYSYLQQRYPDRIHYTGLVKDNQKLELLFGSDIFVLPTWHPSEAFPLTIIEAMRAGNAIVTTNHNFLPSLVKPENGFIVEPRSERAISEAVMTLIKDQPRLREIQRHNQSFAIRHYNQRKYVDSLRRIIFEKSFAS